MCQGRYMIPYSILTDFLRGKCYQFYFIDEQVQVLKDEVTCPHSWDGAQRGILTEFCLMLNSVLLPR